MQEGKKYPKIGISISNSHNLEANGFGDAHQKDVTVEFARHLLANDYSLVFGHDLRVGGYSDLFAQLARVYLPPVYEDAEFRCENYLAWPFEYRIGRTARLDLEEARIKPVFLPKPEQVIPEQVESALPYYFVGEGTRPQSASEEAFRVWSISLYEMRKKMTETTQARIFIGGQIQAGKGATTQGYSGRMPGVLEEGLLAIEAQQPVYLIGAFGGATQSMINALLKEDTPRLSVDYQNKLYQNKQVEIEKGNGQKETVELRSYAERIKDFNRSYPDLKVEYNTIVKSFSNLGMEEFGHRNGLSIEENLRLFETSHIPEMVRLVMRGLNNTLVNNKA